MKKIILVSILIFFNFINANSEVKPILVGSADSKVKLMVFESLTCSHCANFHKNIYPKLKEDFIDKGLISIEFKSFPLDIIAFNATKYNLDFDKCLADKKIEDHILEDRIEGVKKYKVNATPTVIINGKKFENHSNYKKLKKYIEKLI